MTERNNDYDVILIGAGVMSATLAAFFTKLEPSWRIKVFERLNGPAAESSNPWNNAGTGHSALCELNYTKEQPDGSIDMTKAISINAQFQLTRQFWGTLAKEGHLDPTEFVHSVPHMSFVTTQTNTAFLKKRYETLKDHHMFSAMSYTEDYKQIEEWTPLLIEGRPKGQPISATFNPEGTDVNFGGLTRNLLNWACENNTDISYEHEVKNIKRRGDKKWIITVKDRASKTTDQYTAKFVFVGAGGMALPLLQKSGIPEISNYAGLPISGMFLRTKNPLIANRHNAKVYGKASVGAPPMSVPHMDTRWVGDEQYIMFGPFGGLTPKFLKQGKVTDFLSAVRPSNVLPLLFLATHEVDLELYLAQQLMLSHKGRVAQMRDEFYPLAKDEDWELLIAGQRVQVVKKDGPRGVLQFGTELVAHADGSIAGLLGASPGASTAVPIVLDLFKECFPEKFTGDWQERLKELVPTYGTKLSLDKELYQYTHDWTTDALQLDA